MCGIAGIRTFDGAPVDPELLRTMAERLEHRGPDDSGLWTAPGVALAHRRLSIIDLSHSTQPMASPDGRWTLVFNGEIFNFADLRRQLRWDFRTSGDTEVLLAGIALHGIDFVKRLQGQFAFAAYDSVNGVTHLVRDRVGVLPLFYSIDPCRLAFASEVKAILPALNGAPEVDDSSLDLYLTYRSVPSPRTLFAGVRKVRPGHRLVIDSAGSHRELRYWAPPEQDSYWSRRDPEEVVAALDRQVRLAVTSALVADVPVGAYLSGGVDSSLIVAVMSELRERSNVETFSAGFGDERTDELPWARRVSDLLGTTHHEVHVGPDDFESLWQRLTWHRDAPLSEPADVAVFRLAQTARATVKVVLSGEGGDELFAGYPKYRVAQLARLADVVPLPARHFIASTLERALPAGQSRARIALRALGAADEEERFRTWFAPFTAGERERLLGSSRTTPASRARGGGRGDVIDRMLRSDLEVWLPDNLLERGDRMSMAASLELRPPLLDHHLVEMAFKMPSDVKVRAGVGKWALKEVARRYLPAAVVDRRKVGFRVPLDRWFRTGLRDAAWDRLTGPSSFTAARFDRGAVRGLLERHDSGRGNEEMRIWTLLCLEVWHETFMRGAAAPQESAPPA
jgi:asparagine synthase (glutamine-hydrolysing)